MAGVFKNWRYQTIKPTPKVLPRQVQSQAHPVVFPFPWKPNVSNVYKLTQPHEKPSFFVTGSAATELIVGPEK